ncbi:MAG: hypothetical protein ACREPM_12050 [Gemmatimonadaceae bacterium]
MTSLKLTLPNPRTRRIATHRCWLALVFLISAGCGAGSSDATSPRSRIEGTFQLATIDGEAVPALVGIGPRPNASFISPGDSVLYASDQFTFVSTNDTTGTLMRSRSWIYRYRPMRADTMSTNVGAGTWTGQGSTFVALYFGIASTLMLETSGQAFTIHYGPNALFPNGLTGRYLRVMP